MHRVPISSLPVLAALILGAFLRLYRLPELPPGLHHDEAFYGLDALRILRDGYRPIFLDANFGREPLFAYTLAGAFAFLEPSPFVIRLVAALLGLLTLPGLYLLAKELFPSRHALLNVATLSVLALAVSYWHVNFSRLGFRAILFPLIEAWFFYCLWRALHTGRFAWHLAAGLLLGASQYTYVAARLLPFVALFVLAHAAASRREVTTANWRSLIAMTVVASLVALPLAAYFWSHPDSFALRAGQVSILSNEDPIRALADNVVKTFGMFSVAGDENWRQNLPGRPALDPFSSVAFLIGVAIAVWRIKHAEHAFLLAWGLIMLLPTVLSDQAPSFLRAIGVVPVIALLVGLGLHLLIAVLQRLPIPGQRLGYAFAGIWLLASGGITYRDYFHTWASDPELYWAFDLDKVSLAQQMKRLPTGTVAYVDDRQHPSTEFLLSAASDPAQRRTAKWFDAKACLVVPAGDTAPIAYFRRLDSNDALRSLNAFFPAAREAERIHAPNDEQLFTQHIVPDGTQSQIQPREASGALFDDRIALLGYDLAQTEPLTLTLYWMSHQQTIVSYTVFVQLLGEAINPSTGDRIWAQRDAMSCNGSYRTTVWQPGEVIIDRYSMPLPSQLPLGEYEIAIGMYELQTLRRAQVRDASGALVGDYLSLERFKQ